MLASVTWVFRNYWENMSYVLLPSAHNTTINQSIITNTMQAFWFLIGLGDGDIAQVHPDKNKHPQAEEAFKVLRAAWDIVSNPERRKEYEM